MNKRGRSNWGIVTSQELGERQACVDGCTITIRDCRYVWRPSAALRGSLSDGFEVSMPCMVSADGIRHFSSAVARTVVLPSLAGHAIFARSKNLKQGHRYRLMQLLHSVGPRLQEHLARRFYSERDLYVPSQGRMNGRGEHILPPDLGLDADGTGRPWGPATLLKHGRIKAAEEGLKKPDSETIIRLGLLEAARRRPLDPGQLGRVEKQKLVRLALFDLGPARESIAKSKYKSIIDRLWQALEPHLSDDTDVFNSWFFKKFDNIVHQIAKRRRPGGPIPRDHVRQVLLETVFQAYVAVGKRVDLFMRSFRDAVSPPLNRKERALFAAVFLRNSALGMPLALLIDRFEFLKEAICEILVNPQDRGANGVLLRLLDYYAIMASKKRQADRSYKRQSQRRNFENKVARFLSLTDAQAVAAESEYDPFEEIAAHHREQRRAACRCGTTLNWRAYASEESLTGNCVVFKDVCTSCDHTETVKLTTDEFRRIWDQLRS